jgi:hypothetical protein
MTLDTFFGRQRVRHKDAHGQKSLHTMINAQTIYELCELANDGKTNYTGVHMMWERARNMGALISDQQESVKTQKEYETCKSFQPTAGCFADILRKAYRV